MDLESTLSLEHHAYVAEQSEVIDIAGLKLPWRPILAMILTTLLITFDYYYDFLSSIFAHPTMGLTLRYRAFDRVGLYLIIPLLIIVVVFREKPSEYGFTVGDWRSGLKLTLLACLLAAPILYLASRTAEMRSYYSIFNQPPLEVVSTTALDLLGWEFVFRGFLLFALLKVAGPSAVVLQAVPFALGHLGKPPLETFSTIFGGAMFGWVAWRTKSFAYPFLIHLYIMSFTALAVNLIH